MNDITWIILGVLTALTVIAIKLVIPYIKSKTSAEDWAVLVSKAKQVTSWVTTAIKAAEIFFAGTGLGGEKNLYVLEFVRSLCEKYNITFDADAVKAEIEEIGQDLGLWEAKKVED